MIPVVLALVVAGGAAVISSISKKTDTTPTGPAPSTVASADFPENIAEREAFIVGEVQKKNYEVRWGTVTSEIEGHTATFNVFADALKVNGVRVSVTAIGAQQIADELKCLLLTPKVADLIWYQRQIEIPPFPLTQTAHDLMIMATVARMKLESQKIDAALAIFPQPITGLVCSAGKHWVIDDALLEHPQKAENYGWHNKVNGPACVTKGPGVCKVIQDPGWVHNAKHADYSQTCVLMARGCIVDGKPMDLVDVLKDPVLAKLASHTGVMKVLRQPGT